jgi:DNA invertase Pin-like site-specific DNA recombinase
MFDYGYLRGREYDPYNRFSTLPQRDGKSLERQEEARKWVENELGLVLGVTYDDLGRSGFHGANRKRGALKRYLELVRERKIKPGRVLLIEAFDRLTREQVRRVALPMFLDLINYGIVICTAIDRMVYDGEVMDRLGQAGEMMLFNSIVAMSAAHLPSKLASERRKITNAKARREIDETGIPVNGFLPRWLKRKKPGEKPVAPWVEATPRHPLFWVDSEKRKIVRYIFELAKKGFGNREIAHILNREGVPTFTSHFNRQLRKVKGKWAPASVGAILRNPSVIGTYQPGEWVAGQWVDGELQADRHVASGEAKEGFFPVMIPPTLFWEVQVIRGERRNGGGGRKGKHFTNLFTGGIAVCAHCGSPLYYAASTKTHGHYLVCSGHREHTSCDYPLNYPYDILEDQTFLVIKFMIGHSDDLDEVAVNDPELVELLADLSAMHNHLHELRQYKKGRTYPRQEIADLERKIEAQEGMIAERKPITRSRLQEMLDWRQESLDASTDDERLRLRTQIADRLEDIIWIKITGSPHSEKRRQTLRTAEIYWQPEGGRALMFEWDLHHHNSNHPVQFVGVFEVDAEGKVTRELDDSEMDTTMLREASEAMIGNPKLIEYRNSIRKDAAVETRP